MINDFVHGVIRKKKEKKQPHANIRNYQDAFFPPNIKEIYSIQKWYANAPVTESNSNEEDGLVGLELRIFLEASDWNKFQEQEFFQELLQYLDNLEIQKEKGHLD